MVQIRKKGFLNWFHYWDGITPTAQYGASDLVITFDGNIMYLRATNGRVIFLKDGFNYTDVEVYDDTASESWTSFASVIELQQKLINLGHPAYAQQGEIILPENLSDLGDVNISSPTNGQVLLFNSTSGEWENEDLAGGGDMLKSVYDPTGIEADAFLPDNFQQVAGGDISTAVDADNFMLWDSVASIWKRYSFSTLKTNLVSYFNTVYLTIANFLEQNLTGAALYSATTTGAVNIPCSTFVSWRRILTGNTTLTFTETPSSGNSFTRYMDINSTAAETLDFANATHIIGTYANDTSRNKITVELSNFPTEGLVITVFINPVV